MNGMWEALGFIGSGIAVGLIGRHWRNQYWREFSDNARAEMDPAYQLNAQLMRRGATIFLTTGTMMVIVGLYFLLFG